MQEWNDKEIDDMMRKATEQRQVKFDENAWALMQQKLPTESQKPKFWKIWGWLIGLLILGALMGGFLINQLMPVKINPSVEMGRADKAHTVKPYHSDTSVLENSERRAELQTNEKNRTSAKILLKEKEKQLERKATQQDDYTISSADVSIAQMTIKKVNEQETIVLSQDNTPLIQEIVDSTSQNGVVHSLEDKNIVNISKPITQILSKDLEPVYLDSLFSKKLDYRPVLRPTSKDARWALVFSYSPDWSDAKFPAPSQLGTLVGLQAEYQITKRWSIKSGILYSYKKYTADSQDYKPYDGYWQNFTRPDYIDADCNVLEFPIQVRYDVKVNPQSKWFASIGISSYWMLNERYRYVYDYNDWILKLENQNKHFFSIQTISVGVEKSLSQSIKWQIEPFVKIPLSDIGFGNIRLWSSGVMLSLKYQFRQKTNQ